MMNKGRQKVLKEVVMDETVLEILGALPNFSRYTNMVIPVKGVPDKQFIILGPKLRQFIDAILVSVKANIEKYAFWV